MIHRHKKQKQNGSALVYILIAIALLAALTATFMDSSGNQVSSQKSVDVLTELKSQINFIQSSVSECVLTYPSGDTVMPATNPVGGQNPVRPYPLQPNNTYLLNPTSGSSLVENIRCPGNPGNSNNHAKIFGGSSGKFLPPFPKLFSPWLYYNHVDGVFILMQSTKTDAFLDSALQKLNDQFSQCEVQYINNTSGGSNIPISSDGWLCYTGHKCIIVRLKTTASSIFPGEAVGACP